MMTNDQRSAIIEILCTARGDDTYRAKMAFHGMTDAQLDSEYGQSGQTCREILVGYESHDKRINDLIAAMRNV